MPDYNTLAMLAPQMVSSMQRPAAQQPRKRSLFDRLFGTGIPDGLLSDEDRKGARQRALLMAGLGTMAAGSQPGANLGGALATGLMGGLQGGMEAYQQAAQGGMMQQEAAGKAQVAQAREQIYAKYPPAPGETPVQMLQRFGRMLPEFMRIGDTEMVGKLTELLKSVGGPAFGIEKPTEAKDPARVVGMGPDGKAYYFERGPDGAWKNTGLQAKPDAPTGPSDIERQRAFAREQTLASGWEKASAPVLEVYNLVNNATKEKGRALAGDPAAQINFLYAFVRALDPNSVVREGEVRLFEAARPFWSRMKLKYDQYTQTGKAVALTAQEIESLNGYLTRAAGAYSRGYNRIRSKYEKRASRWGVETDILDPALDAPAPDGAGNPAAMDEFLKNRGR